ncbi:MAG: family metallopeptidase [Flaviaesturariibacter sp.]|nr:family metallopeptidase [Flaviaesturariibacter sp.]
MSPMAKASKQKNTSKNVLTDTSLNFLAAYINNPSPVGFEYSGQRLWLDYISGFVDETFTDPYGTAVGVINPGQDFKVVIEAHADEISWFVNYITAEGLIYLKRNGGVDHQVAPSQRVIIHGKKGPVKAVFGWPAIHTRLGGAEKETVPKVENLFLDCGARSKAEIEELGIHVGNVVTYVDGFEELANDYMIGRAFDNRIGGFMIAEVGRLLKENRKKLPFSLYIVNAVQEEIGLRGAEMIARRIKPNIAIITDVTHDTNTPMINKIVEGDTSCGKGPALTYGPAVHNKLLQVVQDVAEAKEIPVQLKTVSRSTGTDTDSFAYANDGCPSVLISIPLRYMHTTVEMLHKNDVEQTIRLMYETLLTLSPKTNLSYF